MYRKGKLFKRLEEETGVREDEIRLVYDTLVELAKKDLDEKGKFIFYPLGEIVLKKKVGKWYDSHNKKVVEGKKLYFKFIPFRNYKKELK